MFDFEGLRARHEEGRPLRLRLSPAVSCTLYTLFLFQE